jgi:hypothetical protein
MKEQCQCQICKKYFDSSYIYEHRGFYACEKHFDELCDKVETKRKEVSEVVNKSVENQRNGEFINNRVKYNLNNVASDGLPIMPIKEPHILKDYENGIL